MIKKNFKILYLDQFASSNLALENEAIWLELKSLIEIGIKEEKLICPIPHGHFLETSQANPQKALIIDNYFSIISNGYMFKSSTYTTSQLIISVLRNNNLTLNTFIRSGINKNVLNDEKTFDYFKNRKQEFNKMVDEATSFANSIRNNAQGQKIEKEVERKVQKAIAQLSTKEFVDRLEELIKIGNITIRGDKFSFIEVPNWIDQIIFRLVKVHRMNPKETKKLISIIKNEGFSKFPTLDIRFSLSMFMATKNKKENSNDHIDIERIATGLPISDYFLIDKQRKAEIIELGFDKKYQTKIFSGIKTDLIDLKIELEKIVN